MAHSKLINGKDPSDPSTTSMAWDAMIGTWVMIDSLLGGTRSMRAGGAGFMPQHTPSPNHGLGCDDWDLGYD